MIDVSRDSLKRRHEKDIASFLRLGLPFLSLNSQFLIQEQPTILSQAVRRCYNRQLTADRMLLTSSDETVN
jgi:hypothetical protein